jgi:hypothetical protein
MQFAHSRNEKFEAERAGRTKTYLFALLRKGVLRTKLIIASFTSALRSI